MSKKKKTSNLKVEKGMAKLMHEIEKQDFESMDDINSFLNGFVGKSLDNLPARNEKKGRSQD